MDLISRNGFSMDILELVNNAKDIYANEYYTGFVKGIIVDNSILLV